MFVFDFDCGVPDHCLSSTLQVLWISLFCVGPVTRLETYVEMLWYSCWRTCQLDTHIAGLQQTFAPPRDKTNKMTLRPAKIQISLGIRPVWSESSLSAWRKLRSLATHWADAQADLSLRRSHSHICWFCHEAAHLCCWTRSLGWFTAFYPALISTFFRYCSRIPDLLLHYNSRYWRLVCLRIYLTVRDSTIGFRQLLWIPLERTQ